MIIDYRMLTEKYKLATDTVLHVGAHEAEEWPLYESLGASRVVWVEANTDKYNLLCDKFAKDSRHTIINGVVSDKTGSYVEFNISNNVQSSSILEFGQHRSLFPGVHFISKESRITICLDDIVMAMEKIDLVNIDIQGAELLALKGMKNSIHKVSAFYLEINSAPVYESCAIVDEIDDFLSAYGFMRAETKYWMDHPWGDALYVSVHNTVR